MGEKSKFGSGQLGRSLQQMFANQPKKPNKDLVYPQEEGGSTLRATSHGDPHTSMRYHSRNCYDQPARSWVALDMQAGQHLALCTLRIQMLGFHTLGTFRR